MYKAKFSMVALIIFFVATSSAQTVSLPYYDDFEGANAGWTISTIAGSSWELGSPSVAPTNTTHSGANAWDVDLDSVYQSNTECYLISPDFDFSQPTSTNSILKFWQNRSTETSWDGVRMDYSTNGGTSWTVLGVINDPNGTNWFNAGSIGSSGLSGWDGNSGGWVKSTFSLAMFNGVASVKFRFAFTSDATTEIAGFTMDDFEISTPAVFDAGVTLILEPNAGSLPGSSVFPLVVIKNYGLSFLNSMQVGCEVNGLVYPSISWTGLLAPNDVDTVFLSNILVPMGAYQICVYTVLAGDGNPGNDTLCVLLNPVGNGITVSVFDSLNYVNCVTPPINDQFFIFGNATGFNDGDTVSIQFAFGDGTDTTYNTIVANSFFFSSLSHQYLFSGQFSVQAIASGNGFSDTLVVYNQLIISDTCGNISGKIYADLNANCIKDGSDFDLANIKVDLMQAGNFISSYYTAPNGDYYFIVPSSTSFDLSIQTTYPGISSYCPPSGTISGVTEPSAGNDFAFIPVSTFDLEPSINPFAVSLNNTSYLNFGLGNNYFNTQNAILKLVLDTNITAGSINPPVSNVSGDTLIWNLTGVGNAALLSSFNGSLALLPKPGLTAGTQVCFTILAEPLAGDDVPANNQLTLCGQTVNSYDPNNKTVEPAGSGPNGAVDPATSSFNYTVNFQNTGTAPAFNVYILDTIDSDLDINTLQLVSSSFPALVTIVAPDVVKFSFHNIFLPDSTSDEPGSHGYVNYSISPKPGLADGTQITNSAAIFFDFNSGIFTNEVTNTIDFSLGLSSIKPEQHEIKIYPNPASGMVNILTEKNVSGELKIFDLLGNLVLSIPDAGGSQKLNISELGSGCYMVMMVTPFMSQTAKLIIIK